LDNHNEFEIIDDYNDIDNIKDSIKRKRKQDNYSSLSENEDSVPDKKRMKIENGDNVNIELYNTL